MDYITSAEQWYGRLRKKSSKQLIKNPIALIKSPQKKKKKAKTKVKIKIVEKRVVVPIEERVIRYIDKPRPKKKKPFDVKALNKNKKRALREEVYTRYGNRCSLCGYDKNTNALVFHHIDPNNKSHNIGDLIKYNQTELLEIELLKCILICWNCHISIHQPQITMQ